MGRSIGQRPAVTWLAACILGAAALGAAEGGDWTIELRQGDRLRGQVRALDGRGLRLAPADPAMPERTLERPALARLWQSGRERQAATGMAVALANGDRLALTAIALEQGLFSLELTDGQCLRAPRGLVRLIQPDGSRRNDTVPSLGSLAEWDGSPQNWDAVGSAFRARTVPAVLIRRGVLAEQVRVELAIAGEAAPDVWLHLFVTAGGLLPGAGYALHVAEREVSLERHADSGAAIPIGACHLARDSRPGRQLDLQLTVDLARRRFLLASESGALGDWSDPVGEPPAGRDLVLRVDRPAVELRQLTVSRLAAAAELPASPEPATNADRVCLVNGDVLAGELATITATQWTVRRGSDARPARLAPAAVHLARLRLPATAPAGADWLATRVVLRDGSEFGAETVTIAEGRLQATSPAWGSAVFELVAVAEIRFGAP